ncbi:hypothetical protein Trydic_g11467 [Trypoxylus dichotomus]
MTICTSAVLPRIIQHFSYYKGIREERIRARERDYYWIPSMTDDHICYHKLATIVSFSFFEKQQIKEILRKNIYGEKKIKQNDQEYSLSYVSSTPGSKDSSQGECTCKIRHDDLDATPRSSKRERISKDPKERSAICECEQSYINSTKNNRVEKKGFKGDVCLKRIESSAVL